MVSELAYLGNTASMADPNFSIPCYYYQTCPPPYAFHSFQPSDYSPPIPPYVYDQPQPPPAPPHPQLHPFYTSQVSPPSIITQSHTIGGIAPQVFDEYSVRTCVTTHTPAAYTSPYNLAVQTTLSTGQPFYVMESTTAEVCYENASLLGELNSVTWFNTWCEVGVNKVEINMEEMARSLGNKDVVNEDSENCEKVSERDDVSTLSVRKDTDMHDDAVNGASEEVKEHELALSKVVDNVVSSIGDSMDLKAKKEKHREYADECRNEMEEKGLQDPLIDKENRPSINMAPIGTGSIFGEKPFEEVEMLNYQKKVVVLYELLTACLVLKPDADSKSIQGRDGYDARHRVALRYLTAWLNINWINMEALETIIASSAMSTLKEEECTDRKTQNKKDSWANWKRGSIIGAAALTGGTIIAITGGLAAPGIAEEFGALTPVSLNVAAIAVTTHIAVAASLGAAGAGLSGMKMASRIGNLEDFEFRVGENNNQSRLAVEILISGFVFEEEDYIRPWEGQANNAESKWSIAIDRSDQAVILLAEEVLLKGLHGQRPVTLIGFSLGARVIFKCLQTLAEAILVVDIGGESHMEMPMPKIRNRITVQIFDPGGCIVMNKFPNKHNHLHREVTPLEDGLFEAIDVGLKNLSKKFDWDKNLAKIIWCFDHETNGPNMVVDMCKRVQYLNEIKDFVVAEFQQASKKGALTKENMRGICFEVCDVVLHADAIHRGGGQVIPRAWKVIYVLQYTTNCIFWNLFTWGMQLLSMLLGSSMSMLSRNCFLSQKRRLKLNDETKVGKQKKEEKQKSLAKWCKTIMKIHGE